MRHRSVIRGGVDKTAMWALLWAISAQLAFASLNTDLSEHAQPPEAKTGAEAVDIIQHPFPARDETTPKPDSDPAHDPCDWDLSSPYVQEDSQEVMRGATCHSFRWFDGLFGDEMEYPADEVNGLITTGFSWSQYDKFEPRLRLRVRAPLPNMSNRWDVLLGRGDEDAFISDTEARDQSFYNPGLINRNQEDSWLLGLGHRRGRDRKGWDWSVGIRLRTPPVPYVKTQWYYNKQFTDATDLRFRQTFFWRDDDGFGTTSRGDFAWGLNPEDVLRWEAVATVSEETEGTLWYFGQTWYHLMGDNGAISALAFIRGETDAEVDLNEYGFNFIWRRPFTRDWLFLSMGPSVTWPRFKETEKRELSLGFNVWIEMEFGDWRY